MLKNAERINEFHSVLDALQHSEYEFHLTGSHFFLGGGNDIDFFVESDMNLLASLEALGFIIHPKGLYDDSQCIAVCRWSNHSKFVLASGQIDIQVVKSAALKSAAQNGLKKMGKTHPTTKDWEMAFEFAKAFEK